MKNQKAKPKKSTFTSEEMRNFFGVQNIEFSTEPKPDKPEEKTVIDSFEERTRQLWEELKITFYWTTKLDNTSPEYLKAAKRLKKIVEGLGSCVITIAAVEQMGRQMPEFAELTIQELMRDVAYNFRKTNAAIQDIGFEMSDEYFALSNLMLDFANLNMRLEATRLKIEALRDGSLDVHDMMDEDDSPRRKTRKRRN